MYYQITCNIVTCVNDSINSFQFWYSLTKSNVSVFSFSGNTEGL